MDSLRPPVVERMTEAELRKFVLGVADRQIFTSAHMHPTDFENVVGIVFMPLAFGALQPEEGTHIPHKPRLSGNPPDEPDLEEMPKRPSAPEPIPKYATIEADPAHIEELEFKIRWYRSAPESVDRYRAEIAAHNEEMEAKWRADVAEQERKYAAVIEEWEEGCEVLTRRNGKLLADHEAALKEWAEENARTIKDIEEWEELRKRWITEYTAQIGVLWEWMSKAGPRAINGYPIFMSMRVMHRDDWSRAVGAIQREEKRREDIEV